MKYLKFCQQPLIPINKPYFTIGVGDGFDVSLASGENRIGFALHTDGDKTLLIPGEDKVRVNGKSVSSTLNLSACDRIECSEGTAVFVNDPVTGDVQEKNLWPRCFEVLKNLAENFDKEGSLNFALQEVLQELVDLSRAEVGNLVSEIDRHGEWEVLASVGDTEQGRSRRRALISSTILQKAIESGKPVYVESIIGHPLAAQASVMEAQLYSFACLPLTVGKRVFGCVYLFTRTPGKSIDQDALKELSTLATQAALLLATRGELRKARAENTRLKKRASSESVDFIFNRENKNHAMFELERRIAKLAGSDLNILVRGETGTGKELVARSICENSQRNQGPFITVNCGAIPPTLMESTLFGYVKGAFTGALRDQAGKMKLADGGTLFLDEIGDLPLELQVKLLRVLQEKQVEPVGSTSPVTADFRVVAATHRDLEKAVKDGVFREDLFYRLNGGTINLSPLRDRQEDIPILAKHFLSEIRSDATLTEGSLDKLSRHHWPGNIRELKQVVERAAVLSDSQSISPADVELDVQGSSSSIDSWDGYEEFDNLKDAQLVFTRRFVEKTLSNQGGNRSKASAHLGISERTLYRILSDSVDRGV